ncbi:MAG: segregation and condensation protein A [Arenicellales bacterium]
MSDQNISNEEEILQLVKNTLAAVAKDTYTPPELTHPLSSDTINQVRNCFAVITRRQQELAGARGVEFNDRPRYVDEPNDTFVVSLDEFRSSTKKED